MKILVATDGSKGSEKAIKFASKLASESKSSLTILHVIPGITTTKKEIIELLRETIGPSKEAGKIYLEMGRKAARKYGIEPNLLLKENNPVETIIKEADKGYDLVVVGSYGKGKIDEFMLGSVSSKLIHMSRIPVLVVR